MSEKLSARNAQKLFNAVNGIANTAAKAATPTTKTVNAKVVQIDADGSVFVDIIGGDTGVPISSYSVPVNLDDNVIVVIDGNKAAITGNLTDKSASSSALAVTDSKAESAATDAARARLAADSAVADAAIANAAANGAVTSLGVVEDIAGTLTWLADHGTYTPTQDTAVDPNKTYWRLDATYGTYSVVASPEAWALPGYYELSIDETVTQYVASHLALTDSGLYLTTDGKAGKLLLSSEGVTLYGADGNAAATFGDSTVRFSDDRFFYIGNDGGYIIFDPDGANNEGRLIIGGQNIDFSDTLLDSYMMRLDNSYDRIVSNEQAIDDMQSLISIDTGEGSITLGGSNSVTARLDNDSLDFNTSAGTVATIGVDDGEGVMDVTRARISDSLEIGAGLWAWAPRNNGNLTLRWIGE